MKRLTCKGLAFFLFLLVFAPLETHAAHASTPDMYESFTGTDSTTVFNRQSDDSIGFSTTWGVVNAVKTPDSSTALSPYFMNRYNSHLVFPANTRWALTNPNTAISTAPELYNLYYAQRQMSSGVNFDNNGSYYFSFLDYVPLIGGSNQGSAMIGLLNGLPASTTDTSKKSILLGRTYSYAPTIQLTYANYAAWNTPYTATGAANQGYDAAGNAWFVIAKITTAASGNDTISLKFFASSDTVPASDSAITWDVTYSTPITGTYNRFAVQTEYDGTIDELRGGLTYDAVSGVPIAPTVGTPTISSNLRKGTSATMTVTSGTSGTFRFYLDGKRIPACLNVSTTGSSPSYTATCTWKPPVLGNHRVYATLTSSDPGYTNSTTPSASITVLPRTGVR